MRRLDHPTATSGRLAELCFSVVRFHAYDASRTTDVASAAGRDGCGPQIRPVYDGTASGTYGHDGNPGTNLAERIAGRINRCIWLCTLSVRSLVCAFSYDTKFSRRSNGTGTDHRIYGSLDDL